VEAKYKELEEKTCQEDDLSEWYELFSIAV
jgi:hypothetical protein